jgi:Rod binding domain-containing protein
MGASSGLSLFQGVSSATSSFSGLSEATPLDTFLKDGIALNQPNKIFENPKKLKETAQQFESFFVQKLLEEMDKTVDREDSLFHGGAAEDQFRSLLHEEMAKTVSQLPSEGATFGKASPPTGLGVAALIYQQAEHLLPSNVTKKD